MKWYEDVVSNLYGMHRVVCVQQRKRGRLHNNDFYRTKTKTDNIPKQILIYISLFIL
jgi:hypothetical protein